jgi:anti-anti-sigma regulatory factor
MATTNDRQWSRGAVHLAETDDQLVLSIVGDSDGFEITELHRLVERATRDPKARALDIDLSESDEMDIRVIGLVLYAAGLLEIQGRRCKLYRPSASARESLKTLSLDRLLDIVD